ncbi:hypothetical protein Dsin_009010 [Dipteronia sinensis]|uniref:RNase H type-1 domain-containing protein n=1 Tax=Dipteronia sinensis TaxID=43782 RepID=A0AAE0AQN5_9ROSI|nr:hypothetical protein Dsin_009010 [Dipteronia sinensis]
MESLAGRRVPVSVLCHVCSRKTETMIHALWGCSGLKAMRLDCDFMKATWYDDKMNFHDFYLSCLNSLSTDNMVLRCVIFWRYWFLRNQLVHGLTTQDMSTVVSWCRNYLTESQSVATFNGESYRSPLPLSIRWQPPLEGHYKVNPDAAIDIQQGRLGLGFVIRECQGFVLASGASRLEVEYSPKVAEATAILRGINFALETGLTPTIVETDALGVVDLVNGDCSISTEIGLIVQDIKDKLRTSSIGPVVFVPRKANMVADALSKMALVLDDDRFWMESYPPGVERVVLEDLPA